RHSCSPKLEASLASIPVLAAGDAAVPSPALMALVPGRNRGATGLWRVMGERAAGERQPRDTGTSVAQRIHSALMARRRTDRTFCLLFRCSCSHLDLDLHGSRTGIDHVVAKFIVD